MHSIVFSFGPIIIRSYALMLAIAFLAGTITATRRAREYGIPAHEVVNLAVMIILASIMGSRLLFIIENTQLFSRDMGRALILWEGGFSYHGGLLFAIVVVLFWHKIKNISLGIISDVCAPAVLIGFFIIRIGCYLNGCCFGTPTNLPWAVIFPWNSPAGLVYPETRIHPTQLYEAFSALISLSALMMFESRYTNSNGRGLLFLAVLALSALWRFIVEFYRYHDLNSMTIGWLTNVQAYCLAVISICVATILYKFKFHRLKILIS